MDDNRVKRLTEYVEGVLEGKDGSMLYNQYKEDILKVKPQEAFEIFYNQLQKGFSAKEILKILDKVINVFNKSLIQYEWKEPEENSFLHTMMKENQALETKLAAIKDIIKEKDFINNKDRLLAHIEELQEFDAHYLKKEKHTFSIPREKDEKV